MVCDPAGSELIVNESVPAVTVIGDPNVTAPSYHWTLPVASAARGEIRPEDSVTACPNVEVGREEVALSAGVALSTTCVSVIVDCADAIPRDAAPINPNGISKKTLRRWWVNYSPYVASA